MSRTSDQRRGSAGNFIHSEQCAQRASPALSKCSAAIHLRDMPCAEIISLTNTKTSTYTYALTSADTHARLSTTKAMAPMQLIFGANRTFTHTQTILAAFPKHRSTNAMAHKQRISAAKCILSSTYTYPPAISRSQWLQPHAVDP